MSISHEQKNDKDSQKAKNNLTTKAAFKLLLTVVYKKIKKERMERQELKVVEVGKEKVLTLSRTLSLSRNVFNNNKVYENGTTSSIINDSDDKSIIMLFFFFQLIPLVSCCQIILVCLVPIT